jgi:hypothetical protein
MARRKIDEEAPTPPTHAKDWEGWVATSFPEFFTKRIVAHPDLTSDEKVVALGIMIVAEARGYELFVDATKLARACGGKMSKAAIDVVVRKLQADGLTTCADPVESGFGVTRH